MLDWRKQPVGSAPKQMEMDASEQEVVVAESGDGLLVLVRRMAFPDVHVQRLLVPPVVQLDSVLVSAFRVNVRH